MGSILSRMRVAATLQMAASMALTNSASTPRDLRVCNESEARVRRRRSHAAIPAGLYNQAVQLCIRPKRKSALFP